SSEAAREFKMPEEIMPWEPCTVKSFEDFVAQWLCMPKAVAWVLLVLCAAGTVCGTGAAPGARPKKQRGQNTRLRTSVDGELNFRDPLRGDGYPPRGIQIRSAR